MPPPAYAFPETVYVPAGFENVQFGGFWVRAVAYVIDRVIVSLIATALGFVIGLVAILGSPNPDNASQTIQSPTFTFLFYAVVILIEMAYFAGQWTLNSQTFGQRVMGVRVVDANTLQPIRPGTAMLRWIGLVISFLACYIGVIWAAFDGRKQGWMDKLAGTVVIRG